MIHADSTVAVPFAVASGNRSIYIDLPETIVTSWLYLVGRCRGIKQCIAKYLHVSKGDAKDRSKYMRFMLAFAMQGVKNVVLEFDAKIRSATVRKFHASNFTAFVACSEDKPNGARKIRRRRYPPPWPDTP